MTPIALLGTLLRPAGAGLHTVSTGRQAQLALQTQLYGVAHANEVDPAWRQTLERIAGARVVLLGVPSDCGAGLVRGAAFGPQALRAALVAGRADFRVWAEGAGVVDAGDVAVVPQLLSDHMLSDEQKQASRQALYPTLAPDVACALPVSPLSIAERALDAIYELNPRARLLVLGGDHSVAWPVVQALVRRWGPQAGEPGTLGIVQPDAHTDLLSERLGVKYCFATWAYHANDLIGRDGRLVQVGVRASSRPRTHWEGTLGVRQFWADELATRGEDAVLADIVAHLRERGVERVYFSNDIDATDAEAAPSTGAPEKQGLSPAFVRALVQRLGEAFELVAADLVEVAPPVGSAEDARRTLALGAGYLWASLEALLASRPS
jgi:arginase family enzyme